MPAYCFVGKGKLERRRFLSEARWGRVLPGTLRGTNLAKLNAGVERVYAQKTGMGHPKNSRFLTPFATLVFHCRTPRGHANGFGMT